MNVVGLRGARSASGCAMLMHAGQIVTSMQQIARVQRGS
jgi:hypothetical protein